LDVVSVILL